MTGPTPVNRALLSVSDKTGLVEFAKRLAASGVELISTGGTAKALREAGLAVRDVAELTGFPEMLDGRVKTLHPAVHGGLLARRNDAAHLEAVKAHDIGLIDLLIVNLYPFEKAVASGADYETCIENIDIGGPALIRAASKNCASVGVVTDTGDYESVIGEIEKDGGLSAATKKRLAAKAYSRTAAYDAAISSWFNKEVGEVFPPRVAIAGTRASIMRYGENPHQAAALYRDDDDPHSVAGANQIQGKELSYNNIADADAAFELVSDVPAEKPAVAIIKHANPCGVAAASSLADAYRLALRCDPVSAFGGIVALNRAVDPETAALIGEVFAEVIIAPSYDDEALKLFAKKKNLRVLSTGGLADVASIDQIVKQVRGGFLLQTRDARRISAGDLKIVTKRPPTEAAIRDLLFAFHVAKHVKSNAIVYVKDEATVGVGAGQMSRVDSSRIAARKAEDAAETAKLAQSLTNGSVVASDAFFPFADGLLAAAAAGATAVIQPGGSIRDEDVIAAADEAGLAMVFTGVRHFRH